MQYIHKIEFGSDDQSIIHHKWNELLITLILLVFALCRPVKEGTIPHQIMLTKQFFVRSIGLLQSTRLGIKKQPAPRFSERWFDVT